MATTKLSGTHLSGYIVKLIVEKRTKIAQDDMVIPFYEMKSQVPLVNSLIRFGILVYCDNF